MRKDFRHDTPPPRPPRALPPCGARPAGLLLWLFLLLACSWPGFAAQATLGAPAGVAGGISEAPQPLEAEAAVGAPPLSDSPAPDEPQAAEAPALSSVTAMQAVPPGIAEPSLDNGQKPVSADTIGLPPARMPDKDDLPPAEPVSEAKPDSAAPKIKLFGTVEFKRPLSSLPGWLDLLKRNQADPIFVPGKHFNKKVTWEQFKEKTKGKTTMDLLRYVNSFWNTWPYREDVDNWGQQDYWEIPAEFLKRSGDCEDYSIIKYFTLKELGIPPETMRIAVIRDTIRNMAHAVLVVYLQNDAYVLDSLSNAVLSHSRFRHYSPQYSVNEFGRWAHLKGRKLK